MHAVFNNPYINEIKTYYTEIRTKEPDKYNPKIIPNEPKNVKYIKIMIYIFSLLMNVKLN